MPRSEPYASYSASPHSSAAVDEAQFAPVPDLWNRRGSFEWHVDGAPLSTSPRVDACSLFRRDDNVLLIKRISHFPAPDGGARRRRADHDSGRGDGESRAAARSRPSSTVTSASPTPSWANAIIEATRAMIAAGVDQRRSRGDLGAERPRLDRRRARRAVRRRGDRADQHPLEGWRGGRVLEAAKVTLLCHDGRIPRHRHRGDARRRPDAAARTCARSSCSPGRPTRGSCIGAGTDARPVDALGRVRRRGDRRSPTMPRGSGSARCSRPTRATRCSRRARLAVRRAS